MRVDSFDLNLEYFFSNCEKYSFRAFSMHKYFLSSFVDLEFFFSRVFLVKKLENQKIISKSHIQVNFCDIRANDTSEN